MDFLQILLISVVVVLTGLLVYIGVQVIVILRDVRRILGGVDEVVREGGRSFVSVIASLKNVADLVSALESLREWVKGMVEKRREVRGERRRGGGEKGGGEAPEQIVPVQKRGREVAERYFQREGKQMGR